MKKILAVALTAAGIAWAVAQRSDRSEQDDVRDTWAQATDPV